MKGVIVMTLGERLKEIRTYCDMKQVEVAQKLGISPQALSSWEKDRNRPNPEDLIALSEVYDISIDELVGNPRRIGHKHLTLSKEEEAFVLWLRGLDEQGKSLLHLAMMPGMKIEGKKPKRKMVTA
jgi:transcriptional regulator with XRE-family HTH domain